MFIVSKVTPVLQVCWLINLYRPKRDEKQGDSHGRRGHLDAEQYLSNIGLKASENEDVDKKTGKLYFGFTIGIVRTLSLKSVLIKLKDVSLKVVQCRVFPEERRSEIYVGRNSSNIYEQYVRENKTKWENVSFHEQKTLIVLLFINQKAKSKCIGNGNRNGIEPCETDTEQVNCCEVEKH